VIVYPAIDIRGGRCVRLVEGDFARETAFDADPVDAANRWTAAGATWIHVVDLDGAVSGATANRDAIARIVSAIDVPIQLGGGIRTAADVEHTFALGVQRAILGTSAIREPEAVVALIERWGDRIAVGLDARNGLLAAAGWLEQTDVSALERAQLLLDAGLRHLIYTDIHRDGTLQGPNLGALSAMTAIGGTAVIASGGIGSIDDIDAVRETGAGGVIVGRALYDGRVDLAEAIGRSVVGVVNV
jgi:phosphoribosylformimino-5-aminoimidazole carboxamide ribotide isomerase